VVVPEPEPERTTPNEPAPGAGPSPESDPPALQLPGPPLLQIRDTGDWVAHLRPRRVFRIPGLVFYCPKRASAACTATVAVPGAGASGTVTVPPSETRGIRLTASREAARRARNRGRLRLRATASYTLPGSTTVNALKRFRLLPRRR
jgi:hypothetical protein